MGRGRESVRWLPTHQTLGAMGRAIGRGRDHGPLHDVVHDVAHAVGAEDRVEAVLVKEGARHILPRARLLDLRLHRERVRGRVRDG